MALLTNEAHFLRFRVFFIVVWFSEDEVQVFFLGKDLVLPQENLSGDRKTVYFGSRLGAT